jgi:NADH-quinone oxidoreductase subunit H
MNIFFMALSFIAGFILLGVWGLLAMWLERKAAARLQFRVGPPWYQNFADLVKLSGKEMLIPERANSLVFIFAPVVSVLAAAAAGTMILLPAAGCVPCQGDAILILYLLAIPSLGAIIGGSSSGNVLAVVGISREIKLLLGYELPFACAVIIPALKSGASTSLAGIVSQQQAGGLFAGSVSGIAGFVIAVFSLQGKIGLVPFDLAEAEGEIASGSQIEYSGILLGLFKLSRAILLAAGPLFVVSLYLGGFNLSSPGAAAAGMLKYLLVLVLMILLKNTNPRLRIDHALRFFWGGLALAGMAAILLAFIGY